MQKRINVILLGLILIAAYLFLKPVMAAADIGVTYQGHVENIGWQGWVNSGDAAGTSGLSYRVG